MFFATFLISTFPIEADHFPFALLVVRDYWLYFVHIILEAKISRHEVWAILKHHGEKFKNMYTILRGFFSFLGFLALFYSFPPKSARNV